MFSVRGVEYLPRPLSGAAKSEYGGPEVSQKLVSKGLNKPPDYSTRESILLSIIKTSLSPLNVCTVRVTVRIRRGYGFPLYICGRMCAAETLYQTFGSVQRPTDAVCLVP